MVAKIKVKLLNKDAKLPTRVYEDAACWDLYSCEDFYLMPWEGRAVNVGVAIELPKGWVGKIYTRSRHGFQGLRVHLGIIDADYRGPIGPFIINHTPRAHTFKKGERIAQIYFEPVPKVKLVPVKELSKTIRGTKGYGSSGA